MSPIENEMTKEEAEKLQRELAREKWNNMFNRQLAMMDYFVTWIREYKWRPTRRWRADFLISDQFMGQSSMDWAVENDPEAMKEIAFLVEIEGGTWSQGRHTRGAGFAKDCEKYNTAASMGWKVFRFTGEMVEDGSALRFLEEKVWK